MKKLTDYYLEITPAIEQGVREYFGYKSNLTGWYLIFKYDDIESKHLVRMVGGNRTKIKFSKLKQFIENSPTREKYRSEQNRVKALRQHNDGLKETTDKLAFKLGSVVVELKNVEDELKEQKRLYNNVLENSTYLHNLVKQCTDIIHTDVIPIHTNLIDWVRDLVNDRDNLLKSEVSQDKEIERLRKENAELTESQFLKIHENLNDKSILNKEISNLNTKLTQQDMEIVDLKNELLKKDKVIQTLNNIINRPLWKKIFKINY